MNAYDDGAGARTSRPTDAAQAIWNLRDGGRTGRDVAFTIYVALMAVIVFAVPAGRQIGLLLGRPDLLVHLTDPSAGAWLGAGVLFVAAAAVMLGAVRGPAVVPPFFATTLASNHRPRRTALLRPFGRTALACVAGALAPAALLGWVLHDAAGVATASVWWFALAAIGVGLLIHALWLIGELTGAWTRRVLALASVGSGAVLLVRPEALPLPSGVYPGAGGVSGGGLGAAGLLVAGVVAAALGVRALDGVRLQVLLEQGVRSDRATAATTGADLAGAADAFRVPPSAGRRLRAVVGGGADLLARVLLYVRRDAVAWLRTPERSLIGLLALIGASALVSAVPDLGTLTGVVMAAAGTIGMWLASGVFTDGIRHGIETLGAPRLFAQPVAAQSVLHAIAPLALVALVGMSTATLLGGGLLLPLLLAPLCVIGRVRHAAKGPMPLALATPIPTPQGDMSVLVMLSWQSDALIIIALAAALLALMVPLGHVAALIAAIGIAGLLLLDALRRVRALTGEWR